MNKHEIKTLVEALEISEEEAKAILQTGTLPAKLLLRGNPSETIKRINQLLKGSHGGGVLQKDSSGHI